MIERWGGVIGYGHSELFVMRCGVWTRGRFPKELARSANGKKDPSVSHLPYDTPLSYP
jgi:hypothetical protein